MSVERILKVKIDDQEVEIDVDIRRPKEALPGDALEWGLIWFEGDGVYFRYPDMAKKYAIDQLSNDYRYTYRTFDIGSMTGQERGELKKPKRDLTKQEKQDEEAFWKAFDSWVP